MLNRLGLTASMIAVLWVVQSTSALSVPKRTTQSPAIDWLCYAKLPSGQVVNLAMLCQQSPNLSETIAPGEVEFAMTSNTQVSIKEAQYVAGRLSGQVTNNTNKPVRNIKVNYEVLDSEGNVVDGGFIQTGIGTISPGDSTTFNGTASEAAMVSGSKVRVTFAEWSN